MSPWDFSLLTARGKETLEKQFGVFILKSARPDGMSILFSPIYAGCSLQNGGDFVLNPTV